MNYGVTQREIINILAAAPCGLIAKFYRQYLPLIITVIAILINSTGAGYSLEVTINADLIKPIPDQDGYGRIIIKSTNRTTLPPHEVNLRGTILVVSFTEPIEDNASTIEASIINALPSLVSSVRLDPDRLSIRMLLTGVYQINPVQIGNLLIIDILPLTWRGIMPGITPEIVKSLTAELRQDISEARQDTARNITGRLQLGVSPALNRLAFVWLQSVETLVRVSGDKLELQFVNANPIDIAFVKASDAPLIGSISQVRGNNSWDVTLTPTNNSRLRYFRDGNRFIVDFLPKQKAEPAISDGSKMLRAKEIDRLISPAKDTRSSASDDTAGNALNGSGGNDGSPGGAPKSGAYVAHRAQWLTKGAKLPDGRLRVGVQALPGGTVRLLFAYKSKTESAFFEHNGKLWLVFNNNDELDLAAIKQHLSHKITAVDNWNNDGVQVVRLTLARPEVITVNEQGNNWLVSIGAETLAVTKKVRLQRNWDNQGNGFLTANFPGAGRVHWLNNPDNGEKFIVVSGQGPPRSFVDRYSFVHINALIAQHGLIFRPIADDVKVSIEGSLVRVERDSGLALSAVNTGAPRGASKARNTAKAKQQRLHFIDLKGLRIASIVKLKEHIRIAKSLISQTTDRAARTVNRIRLAKLLLANDLGYEAIGVLQAISDDNKNFALTSEYAMLFAAANIASLRPDVSLRVLSDIRFNQSPDAGVFKTIASAMVEDWRQARQSYELARSVVGDYPHHLQALFWLVVADMAIFNNDDDLLMTIIPNIDNGVLTATQLKHFNFVNGKLAEMRGDQQAAIKMLTKTALIVDSPAAAKAALAVIILRYDTGISDSAQTIRELETLSVQWRGDDIELRVITRLAEFYIADKRYRDGFTLMATADKYFSDSPISASLYKRMEDIFISLFLNGEADKLEPLQAVSLYYDFRELTPPGPKGDAIIRYLANRLVELDLIAMAAELLEYQVNNRLSGTARATVAARLAALYLMLNKPGQALKVISKTRYSGLNATIGRKRRLISVQALALQGKQDLALELLADHNSLADRQLRINILLTVKKWRRVGSEIEIMVDETLKTLDDDKGKRDEYGVTKRILLAAASYAQINDKIALERLREKYNGIMVDTPEFAAFEVITARIGSPGNGKAYANDIIAGVDTIEQLAAQYITAD